MRQLNKPEAQSLLMEISIERSFVLNAQPETTHPFTADYGNGKVGVLAFRIKIKRSVLY
jgi:hypothetical protein